MMKRWISMLLCLLLAVSALCGAAAEEADLTGEWYLTGVELQGMSLDPAALGLEVTMILNADGTAEMATLGVSDAGHWTLEDGLVCVDTGTYNRFIPADGMLRTEMNPETGMVLVFGREQAVAYVSAPLCADVALEDFDGSWVAVLVEVMDVQMAIPHDTMRIDINNGSAVMTEAAEVATDVGEGVFADGTLSFGMLTMKLHEDGRMSCTETEDGATATIYFVKDE